MSLAPPMSEKQLREIARNRQLAKYGRVISVGLEQPPLRELPERVTAIVRAAPELPVRAIRWLNGINITILEPPRTKKNHGRAFGIKQSAAYKQYRAIIVDAFALMLNPLNLPLDDRPYNLRATYYVDKPGERADLVGLHQGLCDALENAGVVRTDWWFRALDGSRVVVGDPRPRVECLIQPLEHGR